MIICRRCWKDPILSWPENKIPYGYAAPPESAEKCPLCGELTGESMVGVGVPEGAALVKED